MFKRRQRRLLEQGEVRQATVVGIRRRSRGEFSERYEFALDVQEPGGIRRVGVRQHGVRTAMVRLGAQVPVRTDGKRTIIDASPDDGVVYDDWKTLRGPPAEGVRDDMLRVGRGVRIDVELVSLEPTTVLGRATPYRDIVVRDAEGVQTRLKRQDVPVYARHLALPAVVLPAVLDKGRIRLDWARAANEADEQDAAR